MASTSGVPVVSTSVVGVASASVNRGSNVVSHALPGRKSSGDNVVSYAV